LTKDQLIYDEKKACMKAGVPYGRYNGFTAHSLRHTFNTNAMRANIPEHLAMAISGHTVKETHNGYVHPEVSDLKVVMDQVNKFMNGQAEPGQDTPTLLKSILEKLGDIQKNVNKTLTNQVPKEKEASDYVS
jgi:hypothetical protein